jgi:hypothetical protein
MLLMFGEGTIIAIRLLTKTLIIPLLLHTIVPYPCTCVPTNEILNLNPKP